MKTNRLFTAMCLLTALLMGGCTQNEPTDMDGAVQDLPEGKYPLQIASVSLTAESSAEPWGADAPQTRVSENTVGNSSQWDGGEEITVQLSGTMADNTPYAVEGKYILGSDKTTLTPVSGKELYWRSTSAGTITAWYSNPDYTSGNTVNLSNQSNGLAYVLKAEASNVTYNTSPSLSFTHQLAKVRVIITEGTADMNGGKIEIKGYTTCTKDKGTLSGSGDPGWISMHPVTYSDGIPCYEANLVPATIDKEEAFRVTQSSGKQATLDLDAQMSLIAGQLHKVTLTINKSGTTTVDLNEHSGDIYTVDANAAVILDGKGQTLDKRLVIGAGATVMLRNVVLKPSATGNAVTCNGGNTTLILSGKNEITSTCAGKSYVSSGILINSVGTLTIEGPGELKVTGMGDYGPGIAAMNDAAIVINGGTIIASSSNPYDLSWGNPGIGCRANNRSGNITINGGHITAQGGPWAAGIGGGKLGKCGNILIQGEHTVVTATKGEGGKANDIGAGTDGSCGTITFRNGATVNGTKYD